MVDGHLRTVSSYLKRDEYHGIWTLSGGLSRPVSNGVLRLQREQEAGGEVVNLEDAGRPGLVGDVLQVQVTMSQADQIVDDGEQEPREIETCGEHEYTIAP